MGCWTLLSSDLWLCTDDLKPKACWHLLHVSEVTAVTPCTHPATSALAGKRKLLRYCSLTKLGRLLLAAFAIGHMQPAQSHP
jgi:hypothetical protein